MHKFILSSLLFCISFWAGAQEMSFEEYNPVSTLKVPENLVKKAKYPFVDIHGHQWRMATQNLDELTAQMDELNLAVMINLSAGSGKPLADAYENVKNNAPDRFILFANIRFEGIDEPNWGERTAEQLERDHGYGARGLKIFKSLGFSVEDASGKRVAVDDPRLDPIWAKCGELNMPVLIHTADPKSFWDPMDADNERWLELKTHPNRKRNADNPVPFEQLIQEQHNVFKKHPNTKFINAHMGWYPNDLAHLGKLLDEMPNMYVEIGAVIAELGRQPRFAHDFFVKYQDRILFGKDSWVPEEFPTYFRVLESADEYFPYHKKYHAFWAMYGMNLPDEVLKKVYYKNALSLLPDIDRSLFPD
ncbi:amidohydrolase family protein [Peijinzhouia sedimentorum]